MKPGMTEAGDKPAKASRTAHLGYTNAVKGTPARRSPPCSSPYQRKRFTLYVYATLTARPSGACPQMIGL